MRNTLTVLLFGSLATMASDALGTIQLCLVVNPDLTAYIQNMGDEVAKWDGYQITSETNGLDPAGWYSFQDQIAADPARIIAKYGAGALGMGEVPGVTEGLLAELNGAGSVPLPGGDIVPLGKPFKSLESARMAEFQYHTLTAIGPGGACPAIPEPSTATLGLLGIAGLCVARRLRTGVRPIRVITHPPPARRAA